MFDINILTGLGIMVSVGIFIVWFFSRLTYKIH